MDNVAPRAFKRVKVGRSWTHDLVGERFGRLIVEKLALRKTACGRRVWICRCDCGRIVDVPGMTLTRANSTRSCGCLAHESIGNLRRTHGATDSPEYVSWTAMISRCENPHRSHFSAYGGRGIRVCQRWRQSFESFLQDMGPRPRGTTLDRINVDGNYEPTNCRWATVREQANNVRDNVRLTIDGRTQTAAEWAREYGVSPYTVYSRVKRGLSPVASLQPKRPPTKIRHEGEDLTVPQFAERTGQKVRSVYRQLEQGRLVGS